MYIEDREMTPISPIDSTDVPNNHHQLPQQQPQNHNNCNSSVTTYNEINHHNQPNRTISSSTSYNNQKPYIPGMYFLVFSVDNKIINKQQNSCDQHSF